MAEGRKFRFEVAKEDTKPGDKLFLLGGLEELGSWQRQSAVELKTNQKTFPKWYCEVELAPTSSSSSFQYKYLCVRQDGREEWEPRSNRSFVKPETGNVVTDGFGEPDPGDDKNTAFWSNCAHVNWVSQQLGKLHQEISPMQVSMHEYHQRLTEWGPAWEQVESLQRSHEELRRLLEESQANQKTMEKTLKRVTDDFKIEMKRAQPKNEDLLSKLRDEVSAQLPDLVKKLCRDELAGAKAKVDSVESTLRIKVERLEQALGDLQREPRATPKAGVPSPTAASPTQAPPVKVTGTSGMTFLGGGMPANGAGTYSPQTTMTMTVNGTKVTNMQQQHHHHHHQQQQQNGHVSNMSNAHYGTPKANPPQISMYQSRTSQRPRSVVRSPDVQPVNKRKGYFDEPPHPEDEKSRAITLAVENDLVECKHHGATPEEKRKLLKLCNLKVHPDKGGTHEAKTWFEEWKQLHPAYLEEGSSEDKMERIEKLMDPDVRVE